MKAVKSSGTSYDGKIEAIKISTEYTKENISDCTENMHMFVDCQLAVLAITDNENYHHLTISIRENLFDISTKVKSIKIICSSAHKGIKDKDNE